MISWTTCSCTEPIRQAFGIQESHPQDHLKMLVRRWAESIFYIFAAPKGDIAQLARARDWQSRGQGFDSPYLHDQTDNRHPGKGALLFEMTVEILPTGQF